MQLIKLQRQACLAINGAVRTTSTAAMEVLLGLAPLHVMTGVEAQPQNYGLMGKHLSNPKSTNYGYITSLGT